MNALQLVNELLSRFGSKEVTTLAQTAEATLCLRKVNLAINQIVTAHPFVWAQKTTPGQVVTAQGTAIYALANDVADVLAIKHQYQGGGWLKPQDRGTFEQYAPDRTQTADQTTPRMFTSAGVLQSSSSSKPQPQIELWPVPDVNFGGQTLYYYYTFIPTDLVAETDIPIIPQDFHWMIVEQAETLYRRGPIRIGGDGLVSQIDLFQIAEAKVKKGMGDLISRDSAVEGSEFVWQEQNPSF